MRSRCCTSAATASASRHRWVNALVGHLASTFCLIPYYPWKYIHQKHHTWTGNVEHDPVLKSLRTWRDAECPGWFGPRGGRGSRSARCCSTSSTSPTRSRCGARASSPEQAAPNRRSRWLVAGELRSGCGLLAPGARAPSNLALAVTAVPDRRRARQHPAPRRHVHLESRLPIWEQYRATRSCYYPPGVSELLVLNFNFHIEHHLFPDLPWYPAARRARARPAAARHALPAGGRHRLEHRESQARPAAHRRTATERPRRPAVLRRALR